MKKRFLFHKIDFAPYATGADNDVLSNSQSRQLIFFWEGYCPLKLKKSNS